jgi:hypothetical protein
LTKQLRKGRLVMPFIDIDAKNKAHEEAMRGSQIPHSEPPLSFSSGFSSALRICGFVDLIAGLIGALVVWSNAPSSHTGTSGLYAGFALALGFQGVLFCVLFNVIAEMSETLRAIAHRLSQ